MFEAGWAEGSGHGFLVGESNAFSIMDEVQVPNTPGDYVLSWRWDCEQTDQVWNSCADITVAAHIPPTPAPTPAPPPPPPSPAGKGDYLCYGGACYNKPGTGTMDKETCQKTCSGPGPSPSPSAGDYVCYQGKCYSKPGYGKMDKDTCDRTCSKSFVV
jgi:hypothetical protein